MKKQFVLAALTAVLFAAPYAEAGFGKKPSASFRSSSSLYKPSASRSSSDSDNQRSAPSSSFSYRAPAPTKPSAPAPSRMESAPAKSGFSTTPKSGNKGKIIAGAAGATVLGGTLYAATENQNAVAAYEAQQKTAEAPVVADSTVNQVAKPSASTQNSVTPAQRTPTAPPVTQQSPQVIVVKESPRYHSDSDDAYWYQKGRESAQRDTPVTQAGTPNAKVAQPVVPQTSHAQPAVATRGDGLAVAVGGFLLLLLVLGGLYFYLASSDLARKKNKPAAPKPNYTL